MEKRLTRLGLKSVNPPEETPIGPQADASREEFFEALKLRRLESLKVLHLILLPSSIKSVDLGIERATLDELLQDASDLIRSISELPAANLDDWNEFWRLPLVARGMIPFASKKRGSVMLIVKADPTTLKPSPGL